VTSKDEAFKFMMGMRGQYIMAQMLTKGIEVMKAVPAPHTEISNIADAEYILAEVFGQFAGLFTEEFEKAWPGLDYDSALLPSSWKFRKEAK
jgi:hypothetical protein